MKIWDLLKLQKLLEFFDPLVFFPKFSKEDLNSFLGVGLPKK